MHIWGSFMELFTEPNGVWCYSNKKEIRNMSMIVVNASQLEHMDATEGLKRLIKLEKNNRDVEFVTDCVSEGLPEVLTG